MMYSDTNEALHDIFNHLIDEEAEVFKFCHKERNKDLPLAKREQVNQAILENRSLQQSIVFKQFGFRTLQTTMCLKCKNHSR